MASVGVESPCVGDTIAAIATPNGNGGVGIVRISGSLAQDIGRRLCARTLAPRYAVYTAFQDNAGLTLDCGIGLFFPKPASYTGEDMVELQGHGGRVVLHSLLSAVLGFGARLANPGEFTERAFINGKLDLAQAEAVADLINAASCEAARCAVQSMEGVFSNRICALVEQLTKLRVYVESAIDFSDQEIDCLGWGAVLSKLEAIGANIRDTQKTAGQGHLLQTGATVVLAGRPNVGKSSLLNGLTGLPSAIVCDVAGTTRDLLCHRIQIGGLPLQIIDTAGLVCNADGIEKEGVARAWEAIAKADRVLLIIDATRPDTDIANLLPSGVAVTKIYNKIDLIGVGAKIVESCAMKEIYMSAKTLEGMELLTQHLQDCLGFTGGGKAVFSARSRHLDALEEARLHIANAIEQGENMAEELLAEELKEAQNSLGKITGVVSCDDLLGEIFADFCIGK